MIANMFVGVAHIFADNRINVHITYLSIRNFDAIFYVNCVKTDCSTLYKITINVSGARLIFPLIIHYSWLGSKTTSRIRNKAHQFISNWKFYESPRVAS